MKDEAAEIRAVVDEEEALLVRVREAIERARRRAAGRRDHDRTEELRAIRDEASEAHPEDLPSLLHDLDLGQRLSARRRAERLPDPASPYVAHLQVDEGSEAVDYLLGHMSFFDASHGVHVVDWRVAPVARIFYRYREGDDYEETFPGRVAEGVVTARRIVVIEGGVLTRIVGDRLVLERHADGSWQRTDRSAFSLQTGGAGTAARAGVLGVGVGAAPRPRHALVTALLDAEQYAAVSAPPERPLLVLGSAGSGKTTVALHRLAQVSAADPRRYPLSEAEVLVPEEGLARLSRRLLEPLGVRPAHVRTIDEWAVKPGRDALGRALRLSPETPPLVASLKRHPALFRALEERIVTQAADADLPGLRKMLTDAFTDRAFLESVVAAANGDLPWTAVDETVRHGARQLEETIEHQLKSITDPERRRMVDGRDLGEDAAEEVAGTTDVEDLPIFLHLLARKKWLHPRPISLLVLDEAEDFSLFELSVLRAMLRKHGSVTLAGDEAQQTASSFAGWPETLATVGAAEAATVRLPTSYRCPRPISELARRILGPLAPESAVHAAREGAPVGIFRMPNEAQAHLFLAGALRDLVERERGASVGVIAANRDSARRFYALVAELREARLVVDGDFTFEPGIDVTDVDEVKGLEFDYVVVPDATASVYPLTNEARRRLHVAVTRASHQLWIAAGGTASPLLAGE